MIVRFATLLTTLLLAASVRAATAQLQPDVPAPAPAAAAVDETTGLWLIELSKAPVADGGALDQVRSEKAAFRAAAAKAGLRYRERFAFDVLYNGISLAIDPSQLPALQRIAGVKAVHRVGTIPAPQATPALGPDLATAIQMTGADWVHSALGFTGLGVKVAIMDTGIDYDNADLGGDGVARANSPFFPNGRVVGGYDLVGDAYNADPASASFNLTLTPDAYPDDCAGHGTHVAGIVGANGAVVGVAPEAQLLAYRVFGCEGSTNDDVMIAAMERALADGAQVLNMSIGSAFDSWPQAPTAQAASRLVNRGVVVVASIGNSGTSGLFAAGAPGVGDKVIGVASFDNTRVAQQAFTAGGALRGYNAAAGAPPPPTSGSFPLARTGTPASTADGCAALAAGSLAGQIALIRRGTCAFYVKASNAQAAGAAAVVLYNNAAGALNPSVAGAPPVTIPVVAVTAADGIAIDAAIAAGPATLTWTDQVVSAPNPTGGLISSFSSYGLAADLSLKPDVGAPGGSIWSTYPLELGGHTSLSGTSMASPHVAGAVALLLQARPNTPAQAVRGILQGSAVPKPWSLAPQYGLLDLVARQGAGMVRIDDAILATTRIEPAKLSLGEGQAGPVTRTLTLRNEGAASVTYDLSSVNAVTAVGTFTQGFWESDAMVTFSAPSVVVPAGGSATVQVTIAPPSGPDRGLHGGYLVFTPRDGGQVYRVAFAGFIGDYQSITVLAPTANAFPWLAKLTATGYVKQAAAAYTLREGDIPYFLFHLDHQARALRIDLRDAVTGKSWFMIDREEYLPRNSTAAGYFGIPWDGVTYNGSGKSYVVPSGSYVAVLSVLKPLGDEASPGDWETWTSPVFTIAR